MRYLSNGVYVNIQERDILKEFYDSLVQNFKDGVDEGELYMGNKLFKNWEFNGKVCRREKYYTHLNGEH